MSREYDEDEPGSGLGALAWYQLGRWSAEDEQQTGAFIARLQGRAPVARADYDYAVDVNQELVAENQRLVGEIAKGNAWLKEWREKYDQLKAKYKDLQAKAAHDASVIEGYYTSISERMEEIEALEEEIDRLRSFVTPEIAFPPPAQEEDE